VGGPAGLRERGRDLAGLVDGLDGAVTAAKDPDAPATRAARRILSALASVAPAGPARPGRRLPACELLPQALDAARTTGGVTGTLAVALAAIEPGLRWFRRPGARTGDGGFGDKHANAVIVGDGGLEVRRDVTVGVSLMAPHTTYPDHHHPPEEIYVALSAGEWRQGAGSWHAPGPGGLVHNAPDVVHAMRSLDAPLLAIWCLRLPG
jgi:hypothetical protein